MNNKMNASTILTSGIWMILIVMMTVNASAQSSPDSTYRGKIVFAKNKITNESFTPQNLVTSFDANDRIYGRIFLDKPLAGYFRDYDWDFDYANTFDNYNYSIEIYVDGKKVIQWLNELPKFEFNRYRFMDMTIVPEAEKKYDFSMSVRDWLNVVSKLDPGDHKVEIEFTPALPEYPGTDIDPVSKGSFTLNVTPENKKELLSTYRIGLPKATIVGTQLESQIVTVSEDLYPGLVPVEAFIIEPTGKMQYTRDQQENVLNRYFTASVAYRGLQGQCQVKTGVYMQQYLGYDQFDKVEFSRPLKGYYNYQLPCKNIE